LKIEEKKNKNLIKRLSIFFENNEIYDIEVQLEYIKLASIISHDKLKEIYSEDQFNKLLLFIVLNHPRFYLNHSISIENFKAKYNELSTGNLSTHEIGLFIEKVVDKKIYNINFHKLRIESLKKDFYFVENSEYGEIFRTIVDNRLKDLLLMRDLRNFDIANIDIEKTYANIAFLLVERYKLFHPELKNSLYNLIDSYRRTIREQVLKRAIFEITDYSRLLILPEKPESHQLKLSRDKSIIKSDLKDQSRVRYEAETIMTKSSNGIQFDTYKSLSTSFKDLKYISKENLLRKAWDLYEKSRFDEALAQLNQIPDLEENPELLYWKAEILGLHQFNFERALEILETGIRINPIPSGYNFYRLKAEILYKTKDYEEALNSIDKAIEIDSQEIIALKKGEILTKLRRYEDVKALAQAHPSISKEVCRIIFYEAIHYFRVKKKEQALKIIELALDLEYDDPWKHQLKAQILNKLNNYDDALKEIDIAIDLDDKTNKHGYRGTSYDLNITQVYSLKVIILKNLGKTTDVLSIYNKAKSTIDKDRPVEVNVGELLDGILSNDEILKEFDKLILKFSEKNPEFYYLKSKFLNKINRNEEALKTIEPILRYEHPGYYDLQVEILIELERYQEALNALQKAEDLIAGPVYYNEKVDILILMKDFDGVINFIQNLQYPDADLEVYSHTTILLIYNEKLEEAKKVLEVGFEYNPDKKEGFFKDIRNHFHNDIFNMLKDNNLELALDFINLYLKFDDNDAQMFRYKSTVLLKLNDHDEALKCIDKAIELDSTKAEYHQFRAVILFEIRDFNQAIQSVNKSISLNPDIPENYGLKAEILHFANKPNQALEAIKKGYELFPEHKGFYRDSSQILEFLGKYEEALSEINKVLEIEKEHDSWIYYEKAKILFKLQRLEEALEYIDKALEVDPHDFVFIQDKINILESLTRVDDAIDLLNKEKKLFPQAEQIEAQLYQTKAYNLMQSGKKEKAIGVIKRAIELQPAWPEFFHTYGEILMNFENYEDALEQFETAKKLQFTPIKTYIKIGKCLLELGRYEEALKNLEIGKHQAQHSVKKMVLTTDDKRIPQDLPLTELLEEADRYISKVKEKLK